MLLNFNIKIIFIDTMAIYLQRKRTKRTKESIGFVSPMGEETNPIMINNKDIFDVFLISHQIMTIRKSLAIFAVFRIHKNKNR